MRKKYEFTGGTLPFVKKNGDTVTLKQIRSLINIESHHVKVGDMGGYIESDKNLSHTGTAWVDEGSLVLEDAVVMEHAFLENSVISGQAIISNHAVIRKSNVSGKTKVHDNASVITSYLDGDTLIGEKSMVSNCSLVNIRVERPATLDADTCKVNSNEPFIVRQNFTLSDCHLQLESGWVKAATVMKNVRAVSNSTIEIDTNTFAERVLIQNAGLHTWSVSGKSDVVRLTGESKIVLKDGVFLLDRTKVSGNVELDGGGYTIQDIRLSETVLSDFSKIIRTTPNKEFRIYQLDMSECAKLELEAFLDRTEIHDEKISGDAVFSC